MSFLTGLIPSFFRPSAAWLFALLIPVIIFYFLKLRRTRVEISSLALWQQVINDQRVNAPFQKFKRNLLLLLQLLLLSLIALAAMQPFIPGEDPNSSTLPIIIDCSASMGAKDADGKTRLDVAREEVSKIIDGLLPGQQVSLISVGGTARRLTEFTDNKPVLRQALSEIQVQDVPSRLEDGLRLAQALSRTQAIERVRFYSDGNLPTRPNPVTGEPFASVDIDLPFQIDFFQIPAAGANVGITSLNARRASADRWDVFLRIDGTADSTSEVDVLLTADGTPIGEDTVILGPGESQRLVFGADAAAAKRIEATLTPHGADALAADNQAWIDLPAGRQLNVYCGNDLTAFRHALSSQSSVSMVDAEEAANLPEGVDLAIVTSPEEAPEGAIVTLLVNVIPADLEQFLSVGTGEDEIIDWQRNAPLLRHVQLRDVYLAQRIEKRPDVTDSQLEELGYDLLAFGRASPLLLRRRDGTRVTYSLLIDPQQSTMPYRVGFPVFISNLVNEALQLASLGELQGNRTGSLPTVTLQPDTTYRVTGPSGKHEERTTDSRGTLTGVLADETGRYEIRQGGRLVESFGLALLDAGETSLASVDEIQFNEVAVSAEEERAQQDRPLWTQLAFLAFFLLLFEWWYFQRKPVGAGGE